MNKPNVLFIVLDSLRADHTSLHGYSRPTTPTLLALSEDGYAFTDAFAAAPWTPPSHASMFTGRYPTHHGYYEGGASLRVPNRTLAERLHEEGYRTFGAVRNWQIDGEKEVTAGFSEFGDIYRMPQIPRSLSAVKSDYIDLAPGFARVAYRMRGAERKPSDYVSCEYISKRISRSRRPFFGFININAPHAPYAPPEPFRSEFESFDESEIDMEMLRLMSSVNGNGLKRFIAGKVSPQPEIWDGVRDWYDGEIRFADSLVGRLLQKLRSAGVYDDTLIVVTGDHGEHFGEHGRALHQFSLFDELLHVPLVIKPPESSSRELESHSGMVSHVDLYPTILSELGLSCPDTVDGKVISKSRSREEVFAEYVLPTTAKSGLEDNVAGPIEESLRAELFQSLQCVRTDTHKYVVAHGGNDTVYEVSQNDPKDLALENAERADLQELIGSELGSVGDESNETKLDAEAKQNLEQLGYL